MEGCNTNFSCLQNYLKHMYNIGKLALNIQVVLKTIQYMLFLCLHILLFQIIDAYHEYFWGFAPEVNKPFSLSAACWEGVALTGSLSHPWLALNWRHNS